MEMVNELLFDVYDLISDSWLFSFIQVIVLVNMFFYFIKILFSADASDSTVFLDELSQVFPGDDVREAAKELRKNDDIKIQHVAQVCDVSREIPIRCPHCWGITGESNICPYCGVKLN